MPTCFVIMGFGQKTDLATGRVLDLDKSYKNIIKPAVIAAGYECVRADEIQHSGVIDVPMYEMLFAADLVVADLSTANLNAIFELGVRHALKPRATIIMAESKFTIPFDANHIVVRHYEHLGPDIGFDEAMRMQEELTDSDQRPQRQRRCRQSGVHVSARSSEADPAGRDEDGRNCPRGSTAILRGQLRRQAANGARSDGRRLVRVREENSARTSIRSRPLRERMASPSPPDRSSSNNSPSRHTRPARPRRRPTVRSRRWQATPKRRRCSGNSTSRRPPIPRRSAYGARSTSEGPKWRHDRRTSKSRTSTRRSGRPSAASSSNETITMERTSRIS